MKKRIFLMLTVFILPAFIFIQCSKDDGLSTDPKGEIEIKLTDAPSDDANVSGIFITVAEVKIDGVKIEGFSKQTIEISAYQEGNSKLLITEEVEVKSYSNLTLVLDYESNQWGDGSGCYVETNDNKKHKLEASSETNGEITLTKQFKVEENSKTQLVVDFDLRKCVVRDTNRAESYYKFVSSSEMQSAVRIVNEENSGETSGTVNNTFNTKNETYIFIYNKGDFNASTETAGQGISKVRFANAVTSAKVKENGQYKLSFLEEGDYEIHLASYEKESNGKHKFKGMLNANSLINGILLTDISVAAQLKTTVTIEVVSIL